jgi:hypothetical protein
MVPRLVATAKPQQRQQDRRRPKLSATAGDLTRCSPMRRELRRLRREIDPGQALSEWYDVGTALSR